MFNHLDSIRNIHILKILSSIFFIIFTLFLINNIQVNYNNKLYNINEKYISDKTNNNCYITFDISIIKIIHFVVTRFMVEFGNTNGFPDKLYTEDYILNGIRVMKKYLFTSLENQSCKNFTWVLLLGNKANINYIKSLFNFHLPFKHNIVYEKDFKNYVRNQSKGYDVLITTRIDYDDIIYYDAVNDVRKIINIRKPLFLYGYNRGLSYIESTRKYYGFYNNFNNQGVMSIFLSLIVILNKVNDTYTVYDLGDHTSIKAELIKSYKKYGLKELNYEPAYFDNGDAKFIYVRQNYSGTHNSSKKMPDYIKSIDFNINKIFGNNC